MLVLLGPRRSHRQLIRRVRENDSTGPGGSGGEILWCSKCFQDTQNLELRFVLAHLSYQTNNRHSGNLGLKYLNARQVNL